MRDVESVKAQSCLPTAPLTVGEDWVTEKACEMSRREQDARMRWIKSPDNCELKEEYQSLKAQSRKCADKVREEWWETKAVEAEEMHESAVNNGHGCSILIRLLKTTQILSASTSYYPERHSLT